MAKRKFKNYSLYYIIVGAVVVITFIILSLTVFFKAEKVIISGVSIYSSQEIVDVARIKGGDNLILSSMKKIEKRITNELIYIEAVKAERIFPSGIKITVNPAIESTNVKVEDKYYVLSQKNVILTIKDNPIEDALTINGVEPLEGLKEGDIFVTENERRTEILYDLIKASENELGGGLTFFDMENHLKIKSVYDDRISIEFGTIADFEYKLRFAESIIDTKIGPETKGVLTLLGNSASFIDENGLKQNEKVYLENLEHNVLENESETDKESETNATSELLMLE